MSSCTHAYEFRISSASKVSKQKPCTNIPITCKFCLEVHWKYNIQCHLQERHPSWKSAPAPAEVESFSSKISITHEEKRLGIPDGLVGHSIFRANAPDVRRSQNLPQIYDSHGESPH